MPYHGYWFWIDDRDLPSKRMFFFMTAHDTPQWQERAAKMDAVAYLRKPFDQQSLFDAIHLIN